MRRRVRAVRLRGARLRQKDTSRRSSAGSSPRNAGSSRSREWPRSSRPLNCALDNARQIMVITQGKERDPLALGC